MTRSAAAFVASVLGLVACGSGTSGTSNDVSPTPETITCRPAFEAPTGSQPLETFEEEYPDHVGVRLGFRIEGGNELHAFAGIPGEFGEGLPDAGTVSLTHGRTGRLFGRDTVWVLVWEEGGVCDPRAVLGNGSPRPAFLEMLEAAGVVSPG